LEKLKIVITGSAGFIGFHLAQKFLEQGYSVIGIDNLNDYYDVQLKIDRLEILQKFESFIFYKIDITQSDQLEHVFRTHTVDIIYHLAAQAGVRYSIINPKAYIDSNIIGFFNILEISRNFKIKHLFYASSSSVYGNSDNVPYSVDQITDQPVSLYAATKKSNELMAYSYSSLYQLNITGFRFFTVYGPWGRPDMAYFSFTNKILKGEEIQLFNNGQMLRDFTFIDDVINSITKVTEYLAKQKFIWLQNEGAKVFNIGNSHPEELFRLIDCIQNSLGTNAIVKNIEMQKGDVYKTFADISPLVNLTGTKPQTSLEEGIRLFVSWFISYNHINR
jgi:UDP-glucuronate 4-epimerase